MTDLAIIIERDLPWKVFGGVLTIPGTLSWYRSRPMEMHITFPLGRTWVFSRALIADAKLYGKAGEGDVRVEIAHGVLTLCLISDWQVTLRTAAERVETFVMRTYAEVPSSAEEGHLPLDDEALRDVVTRWEAE